MMRNFLLPLLFSGLILSSCISDVIDKPETTSGWVVIGNALSFRNEFINMAHVVRLTDSNLTVFSVAYPEVELNFPIRDSTVMQDQAVLAYSYKDVAC
jgi:hypothetical protein